MAAPPTVSPLPRVGPTSLELWWSPDSDIFVGAGTGTNRIAYSYDAVTWSGTGPDLFIGEAYAVEYGGRKWVAGGGGGSPCLAYSYDGINWLSSDSSVFSDVCYGLGYHNGRWVAGGQGTNQMAYSVDGIDWNADISGNALLTLYCYAVTYANGLWLAGGSGISTLIYSTDGSNWIPSSTADAIFAGGAVYRIAYGGGKWVAGGDANNKIAYSYDGINWFISQSGAALLTYVCFGLAYGNGVWVAGGLGETSIALIYSYDGINWLPSPSGYEIFLTGLCYGITYINGVWSAAGEGANKSAYSYDGINWTASQSANNIIMNAIYYMSSAHTQQTPTRYILQSLGPGPWVAGGSSSNTNMIYSLDGINWVPIANDIFTSQANAVAYAAGLWVAGGSGTTTMAYSTDGINWIPDISGTALFETDCVAVTYGGGQWVAAGTGLYQLAYSSDGINWTGAASTFPTQCSTVAYGNGRWLAGGGSGSPSMLYSTDGQIWYIDVSGSALFYAIDKIVYANSLWIVAGITNSATCFVSSSDGINWTPFTSLAEIITGRCQALAYGNGTWVAGGYGTNQMAYSYDAVTWYANTAANAIFTNSCRGLYNANGVWTGAGDGGNQVAYSYDGLKWFPSYSGNDLIDTTLITVATPPANPITLTKTAPNTIITGLTTNTTYSFIIQSDISGALSAPVPFRTVTTCAKPLPVTGLAVSQSIANNLLTLTATWTDPTDYATYHVYGLKCTGANDTIRESLDTNLAGRVVLAGLDPTLPYTFHIQRGNDAGYSTTASVNTTKTTIYDPRTVTGLQVWLDAKDTAGNGSVVADNTTVTSWQDKSGNGRVATGSAVLKTDSVGRYLNFTASSYNLASSSWIYGQPYTIFIVDKPSNTTGPYTLIGAQSASTDQFNIRYQSGIILSTNGDNQSLGTAFTGLSAAVNVWCFTNYGGKTAYWNKQVSGKAASTDNLVNSLLSIGSNLGSAKYTGRMREVLIYTGRMAEADREAISDYLYEKWMPSGFPTVPVDNGAVLWLDGQDERTFYEDSAGAKRVSTGPVGLWKDKSGADNHMVGAGTYHPRGIDAKGCFISGGTIQTANFMETADATLFLVGQTLYGNGLLFGHDSLGNYGLTKTDNIISWHQGVTLKNNEFTDNGTPFIFYGRMRKGQLLSGTFVNSDGVQNAYTVEALNLEVAAAPIKLASNPVNYGEVLYYNRVLTDAEMASNAGYLSAKWAIPISSADLFAAPPGARFWLDASDPSSLITSGGTVTAWRDRSGNGNNAVPFGSPAGSATGVVFNGSQKFQLPDGAMPQGNYSAYIVAKISGNSTILHGGSRDIIVNGEARNAFMDIKTVGAYASTTFDNLILSGGGFVTTLTDTNAIPNASTTVIIESLYGTTRSLFLSGLAGPVDISSRYQDASNNYIGWDLDTGYMQGTIMEILVYGVKHAPSTRQQVERYLKNKWYPSSYRPTDASGVLGLWLDSDPNTFSYTGTGINSWYDKWGRANATQSALWAQPIYSLDPVTNKNGVQFGSDGITTGFTARPFTNTSEFTVFAVQRADFTSDQGLDAVNGFTNTIYDASGFRVGTGFGPDPTIRFDSKSILINKRPVVSSQVMTNAAAEYVNGVRELQSGWVAAGYGGIAVSYNGSFWIAANNNPIGVTNNAVAWNGSYWVAVGNGGNSIAKSTDGLNWVSATNNPFPSGAGYGIGWNGSYWLAGGSGSSGTMAISTDGMNWTPTTSLGGNDPFIVVCSDAVWNGTYWMAVGVTSYYNASTAISSDGITWVSANPFEYGCSSVAWNGAFWITQGQESTYTYTIATSFDGMSWTYSENPFLGTGGVAFGVAWNGNDSYWVSVGKNSDSSVCIAVSYDGNAWYPSINNPFYGGYGEGISWNGSYWVAVGQNLGALVCIAMSYDGFNWTDSINNISSGYSGIAYGLIATPSTTLPPVTTSTTLKIGYSGSITPSIKGAMRGYIYELVVYNSALSTSDREAVEGYLAWKWGVQDLLPSAHPYFFAPP